MSTNNLDNTLDPITVAILQAGPECLDSLASLNALLNSCDVNLGGENQNFNESHFASIIAAMIKWVTTGNAQNDSMNPQGLLVHMENFLTHIKSFCQNLNWKDIMRLLDNPNIAFSCIPAVWVPIHLYRAFNKTNDFAPISAFWENWTNSEAQISFLYNAINGPENLTNIFSSFTRPVFTMEKIPGYIHDTISAKDYNSMINSPWNCLDLIEFLLLKINQPSNGMVKKVLSEGLETHPDLLLLGLIQLLPFQNNFHEKSLYTLYQKLLDMGSKGILPFTINWLMDSSSLFAGFKYSLLVEPKYLIPIYNVCDALHILPVVYYSSDYRLTLPLMTYAHKKEYLNLLHWVEDNCKWKLREVVANFINYFGPRINQLVEKNASLNNEQLTYETAAHFIHVLLKQDLLPPERAEIQSITNSIIAKYPAFDKIPIFNQQGVSIFKNTVDVEEETNSIIYQFHQGASPHAFVQYIVNIKISSIPRDIALYSCILSTLLENYQHFDSNPNKPPESYAELFGLLVYCNGISLSLEKAVVSCIANSIDRLDSAWHFKFVTIALLQVKFRLLEFPVLLERLRPVVHAFRSIPDLFAFLSQCLSHGGFENGVGPREVNVLPINEGHHNPAPSFENLSPNTSYPVANSSALDPHPTPNVQNETGQPDRRKQDEITFSINNMSPENIEEKAQELIGILDPTLYEFFSHYLVVKRVVPEQNNQQAYMRLLEIINNPDLNEQVLADTYKNIHKLLDSKNTANSSQERGNLKKLGIWLGLLTLAKNKPILHEKISFKEVLINGYLNHCLNVAIPFTCKVLYQGKYSVVFKPPNPWLMAIIRLLVELSKLPVVKPSISFEIEILLKEFKLKVEDIQPSEILKDTDLMNHSNLTKDLENMQLGNGRQQYNDHHSDDLFKEIFNDSTFDIANNIFINPSIIYAQYPHYREVILDAVVKAISAVVEGCLRRSIAIACNVTKDIIIKDFVMESDDEKLQNAAHTMGRSVAGFFAHVTCKEHVMNSIYGSLTHSIKASGLPLDPIRREDLELIAHDNFKLCVYTTQNYAAEGVVRFLDRELEDAIVNRRKCREQGKKFYDLTQVKRDILPINLPELLQHRPTGLLPEQLNVYDDFRLLPLETNDPHPHMMVDNPHLAHQNLEAISQDKNDVMYNNVNQISEIFTQLLNLLDRQIALIAENPEYGHAEFLEIFSRLDAFLAQPTSEEALYFFAQKFVQRIYRSHLPHGQVAYITLLDTLFRCSMNVAREVTNWMIYSDDERKLVPSVTKTLLKHHLITLEELDPQLAKMIESGRTDILEYSLVLMRKCLTEDPIHGTYTDFKYTQAIISKLIPEGEAGARLGAQLEDIKTLYESRSREREVKHLCAFFHTEWVRIYRLTNPSEKETFDFVNKLSQHHILSDAQMLCMFIRTCIQITLEGFVIQGAGNSDTAEGPYFLVDSLAKMIVVIARYAQDMEDDYHNTTKASLFSNMLIVINLMLAHSHITLGHKFHPKPFLRLYSSILYELHTHADHLKAIETNIYFSFSNSLFNLQPGFMPGFAFAWVSLLSHRHFLPKMMTIDHNKGWDYILAQFLCLFKFLGTIMFKETSPTAYQFYNDVFKFAVLVLHDYPEFFVRYHFELMSVLPLQCAQLRNVVCSAMPSDFTFIRPQAGYFDGKSNSEILPSPTVPSNYTIPLEGRGIMETTTQYLATREPINFLFDLKSKLKKGTQEHAKAIKSSTHQQLNSSNGDSTEDSKNFDYQVINSLVLYIASADMTTSDSDTPPKHPNAAMDIYHKLFMDLDDEGRHIFINSLFSHLRYPNRQTQYFITVVLRLFSTATELVHKQQIFVVLMDRLMAGNLMPWGVLTLLIELFEGKEYDLLNLQFIQSEPGLVAFLTDLVPFIKDGPKDQPQSAAPSHPQAKPTTQA